MFAVRIAALAGFSLALAAPIGAQPATYTVAVASFSFSPHPIQLAAGRPAARGRQARHADVREPLRRRPRFHREGVLRQLADPRWFSTRRRDRAPRRRDPEHHARPCRRSLQSALQPLPPRHDGHDRSNHRPVKSAGRGGLGAQVTRRVRCDRKPGWS